MGSYTGLHVHVKLRHDAIPTIAPVLRLLDGMENSNWIEAPNVVWPNHPFFAAPRGGLYFFRKSGQLDDEYWRNPEFNPETGILHIACNLKNYDDEIPLFLDWIDPYVETCFTCEFQHEESLEPTKHQFKSTVSS